MESSCLAGNPLVETRAEEKSMSGRPHSMGRIRTVTGSCAAGFHQYWGGLPLAGAWRKPVAVSTTGFGSWKWHGAGQVVLA